MPKVSELTAGIIPALLLTFILITAPAYADEYGELQIRVLNYHGDPLKGAEVTIQNSTVSKTSTTDSNGIARIEAWDNLTYVLTIKYRGITVYSNESWVYSPQSSKVKVDVFNLRIRIMSSGKLDAVPGARVNVKSSVPDPDIDETRDTNKDGYVIFSNLPGNIAYVITIRYSSVSISKDLTLSEDNFDGTVYELPLYRLVIIMLDRESRVTPNVEVNLWRSPKSGPPLLKGKSDPNGKVVFKLLDEATYVVESLYRGEVIDSRTVDLSRNEQLEIRLPLKNLIVIAKSLLDKVVKQFKLVGRLYADGELYAETTAEDGELVFGLVREDRDYKLKIYFEGEEVFSGTVRSSEIGYIFRTVDFGDFSLTINDEGLFGELPRLLRQARVVISVGSSSFEAGLKEGYASFREHPLVNYSYKIMIDDYVVGEGKIAKPKHQQQVSIRPTSLGIDISVETLNGRPAGGYVKLYWDRFGLIGSANISSSGSKISGLLPLTYRFEFFYKGVKVAEGALDNSLLGKSMVIQARIADVSLRALDYDSSDPLADALAIMSVASYKTIEKLDEEGYATFRDVPLSRAWVTIIYKGVKVYSAPLELSPTRTSITIEKTPVYDVYFKVLDGERRPLQGAAISGTIGDHSFDVELDEGGSASISMIPNGSLTVSVKYKGIKVGGGVFKILRDKELINIVARVYTLRATVFKVTSRGEEPLEGARLGFEVNGKVVLYANTSSLGVASLRLPATNYRIVVVYKGIDVGERIISHEGFTNVKIAAAVYESKFKLVDVDGSPLSDAEVTIKHEGRVIESIRTDKFGVIRTYLPKGEYELEFSADGKEYSIPAKIEDVHEQTLLHIPSRTDTSSAAVVAAAALFTISIYGFIRNKYGTIRRGVARSRREVKGWRRVRRVRRNI